MINKLNYISEISRFYSGLVWTGPWGSYGNSTCHSHSQFLLLISGGKMNNTRLLARSMEYGCSMSTISYVSMMLITANTVANLITNINVNSNDDNNNKSGNVKVEDFKNILSVPALLYILKLLHWRNEWLVTTTIITTRTRTSIITAADFSREPAGGKWKDCSERPRILSLTN